MNTFNAPKKIPLKGDIFTNLKTYFQDLATKALN